MPSRSPWYHGLNAIYDALSEKQRLWIGIAGVVAAMLVPIGVTAWIVYGIAKFLLGY